MKTNKNTPHIKKQLCRYSAAIVGTLAICALFLLAFGGQQRFAALYQFLLQPISSVYGWQEMIGSATVYLLVALGVSVMYQCRQYSLISEGSFLMGACATSLFLLQNNTQPSGYLIVMGLLIGVVAGQVAALIPAFLHAKRGLNVTLVSAVTNFFILEITTFFLQNYMSDPATGMTASFSIPSRMRLPYLYQPLGIRVGTLLALVCAVIAYFVLYRTRQGYEIRIVGENRELAAYMGLSSGGIIIFSQLFAGAMAGLGGAVEMMGISTRYVWNGAFSNVGVAAILIAIFANCNPLWVAPSALLFAYFNVGGALMQQQTSIPSALAGLAQALLIALLFVGKYYDFGSSRRFVKHLRAAAAKTVPDSEEPESDDTGLLEQEVSGE